MKEINVEFERKIQTTSTTSFMTYLLNMILDDFGI